jgi:GTP-binding protein Era
MDHRAGFVNIIGNPNVGKSTLMNALIGEKLSIITSKAQTTRHRILGIVNGDDYQIVYSDLPGLVKPSYKLQEKMMGFITIALKDADIFLYMVEAGETRYSQEVVDEILKSKVPVIVIINKIDLSNQEAVVEQMKHWQDIFHDGEVVPISALKNFNTRKVLDLILERLPESPPYYPKGELTDKTIRFFVSEIIREKVLLNFKQEIPYSVEIIVESYKEAEDIIHIGATIFVMRESQKMIILGKGGQAIRRLGTDARKDIEAFVDKKVFLDLTVKVNKDWRESERELKRFGYES